MTSMKICFTCVGRRVELIQAFRLAAKKLNIELQIYGTDISEYAPALQFCDQQYIVPKISDNRYLPTLQKICRDNDIDALFPTIDTDLLLLAQNRDAFGNTRVYISSPEKVALCRDKRKTAEYFHSVGLLSPDSVDDIGKYNGGFPAFIKPRDGSSSKFAFKANSMDELLEYSKRVPNYIIQPFVDGTEYTIDVFCDFEGNPVYITPRIRLEIRAGEVVKTEISQDAIMIREMKGLIADYRPRGQITVQLIRDKKTGLDHYIEINPRFGGGAPLSIQAGADSAEMLLRELSGEKLSYYENAAEDGAVYSRFDQCARVK